MKSSIKCSLFPIVLLLLCGIDAKANNNELPLSIAAHEWHLIQYGYQTEDKAELIAGTKYTLKFNSNTAQVSGEIDCNHFSSRFTVHTNKVFIEAFPITEMDCGLASFEYKQQYNFIISALSRLSLYKISKEQLFLESIHGEQLVFTRTK